MNLNEVNNYTINIFQQMPNIPQNCCYKLINENEIVWKLLKYNTNDAWKMPNLTRDEKISLIYPGTPEYEEDYNVYYDTAQDDVYTKVMTMLRIVVYEVIPDNSVYGDILMGFEIFSHYKTNTMSNGTTKVDVITQQLIQVFNGQFVEGVGTMIFNKKRSARCRAFESGLKPYKGKILLFANNCLS